ncbi:5.4-kDa protein [Tetterwort vein chlorosis virus]|uniref:5.4-kDa protein n=1 Tax=Tetterwort vein chlorosis virus TaxID=1712389 RepID=A0A0M4MJV3_9CLOS|nr:5.4-kDa protein [Tetterwort vein chlorosis virus]ALE18218.1 5.4-kDa protein [Tetterwort vein chlorosis virus]
MFLSFCSFYIFYWLLSILKNFFLYSSLSRFSLLVRLISEWVGLL